ncbi:MAG: hypothetical protein ACI97A_001047 [Planctomycetota bacterium]|jgi:hypothetical protein
MQRRNRTGLTGILLTLLLALPFSLTTGQENKNDTATDVPVFTAAELDQLLAPIALYPDELVVQILIASTYPIEIIQAKQWVKANGTLKGDALRKSLEKRSWDESVKSLVNFPDVLDRMNEKLDWVQTLGDAVISQQTDVLAAIQRLRKLAKDSGNLEASEELEVLVVENTIIIESSDPRVIFVPRYFPPLVYPAWPHPEHPCDHYCPPSLYPPKGAAWGVVAGVVVGAAWHYAWGGCDWGHGHHDWHHGGGGWHIDSNQNRNVNRGNRAAGRRSKSGAKRWTHNPKHRKGVHYRDPKSAKRFNRQLKSKEAATRREFRGRMNSERQKVERAKRKGETAKRNKSRAEARANNRRARTSGFSGYGRGSRARANGSRGRTSRGRSRGGRPSGGGHARGGIRSGGRARGGSRGGGRARGGARAGGGGRR